MTNDAQKLREALQLLAVADRAIFNVSALIEGNPENALEHAIVNSLGEAWRRIGMARRNLEHRAKRAKT